MAIAAGDGEARRTSRMLSWLIFRQRAAIDLELRRDFRGLFVARRTPQHHSLAYRGGRRQQQRRPRPDGPCEIVYRLRRSSDFDACADELGAGSVRRIVTCGGGATRSWVSALEPQSIEWFWRQGLYGSVQSPRNSPP